MKRYLLFYSADFYPSMGFNDMRGSFNTTEACHQAFKEHGFIDFVEYHIYDSHERKIVFCNDEESPLIIPPSK
jgi:hypothetical protein